MNLIRVLNEVIDLDEISSWKSESGHLLLSFRNGNAITLEFRDRREERDILRMFETIRDKKSL